MALLDPYEVDVDGPWSAREAAHLLRRATFGGIPAEIDVAVGDGTQAAMEAAVDDLVTFLPLDPHLSGPAGPDGFGGSIASLPNDDSNEGKTRSPVDARSLSAHLFYRMFFTSQPFQEQFNLFLHDHFVSTYARVDQVIHQFQATVDRGEATSRVLLKQNRLLREIGADSFRETLIQISRETAMLIFLDNWVNGLGEGRAQENYAREIMELFSMGVDNYSEEDVREIAKCFTGEGLPNFRDDGAPDAFDYGFRVGNHVRGTKTVFGIQVSEDLNGGELEQVVDLILSRVSVNPDVSGLESPYNTLPAAAVYMSWKLLRWFLNQNVVLDPPDPIVLELADYMRGTDDGDYPLRRYPYDFRACMRKLFLSKTFQDVENYFSIVKTPVDFCISVLKYTQAAVGRGPDTFDYNSQFFGGQAPVSRLREMGMELFNPLDVSGWRHGLAWINAEYLLNRYAFAENNLLRAPVDAEVNALNTANGGFLDPTDHGGMIAYFTELFLQDDLETWAPGATAELTAFLQEAEATIFSTETRFEAQVRGLMFLLMSLPVWQMK
ncbi:MAG: DUF1800 family protein [Candidatus Hydrogenedentes bacterium]|nr:DUF1800 family protein [Candidatus Hydrogenedentota bacterium]